MAIQLGEETEDDQVIGYASAWISWICTELGLTDKAILYAEKAQEIYRTSKSDQYIYFNSMAGMGYALWHRGEKRKTWEVGENLLKFGRKHANVRSMVMGYCCRGWSHLIGGDFSAATSCFRNAVRISPDPWYCQFPKLALCYGNVLCGEVLDSEKQILEILDFSRSSGAEFLGAPAHFFEGVLLIAKGDLTRGMTILEDTLRVWQQSDSKLRYTECSFVLAKIYSNLAGSPGNSGPTNTGKNKDLLARKRVSGGQKAEFHFNKAIEAAEEIGAKCILGQAYLGLGLLHKETGKTDKAKKCLSQAVQIFEQCDAEAHLKEAEEALVF
jgi:tetratricopeptide (TPR) repeat protein